MLLLKVFFYFIFFKVMFGSLFSYEYPIVAAAIMAIAIGLVEYGAAAFYAKYIGMHLARISFTDDADKDFWGTVVIVFLVSMIVGILSALFITMGFASRFYKLNLTTYRGFSWGEIFWFSVPIIITMSCNFALVISGIKQAEKRVLLNDNDLLR